MFGLSAATEPIVRFCRVARAFTIHHAIDSAHIRSSSPQADFVPKAAVSRHKNCLEGGHVLSKTGRTAPSAAAYKPFSGTSKFLIQFF
jgi:hypothetical protein